MHVDVVALLALQKEDDALDAIRARGRDVAPRLAALDVVRDRAAAAMQQLQSAIEADERKHRDLTARFADHKVRHERNVAQLDVVKRMREATAAMAQVEMGRRILVELETEVRDLAGRVAGGHKALREQEAAFERLGAEQAAARAALEGERGALEGELRAAGEIRSRAAEAVERALRSRYDRIRARRNAACVFVLSGGACGNCDTAVPVQRRSVMMQTGVVESCEACGVLVYAGE